MEKTHKLESKLSELTFSDNYLAKLVNHESVNLIFAEITTEDQKEIEKLYAYEKKFYERTSIEDLINLAIKISPEKLEYIKDKNKYYIVKILFK